MLEDNKSKSETTLMLETIVGSYLVSTIFAVPNEHTGINAHNKAVKDLRAGWFPWGWEKI